MKNKLIAAVGIVGIAVFTGFTLVQTAFAATFTVTKVADTNDGVCDADCSLREAITAANASAGADTITVPAGTYTLSIAGTGEDANASGDLDITDDLTINGAGNTATIIDGADIDRVLEVRPGATVAIDEVTIQNGKPNASGGGILNHDTLTLTNSTITSNTGLDFGGGIFNADTLTIANSTVNSNETTGFNLSGGGGGIFTQGTLTATGITVNNNTTLGRGGGIYNLDQTLAMTNSTISTNTALNGGGIFNRFGTVNLIHMTLTGNTATDNGGGIWNFGGTMTLANTIISGNTAVTPADDCAGGMTSLGYNLAGDATCAFGAAGDLNSTNPLLGPLANNGGPTQTHALLAGSPAIDIVPLVSCTVSTDQRGVARPQGAACDGGSFEHPHTLPVECAGNINDYNIIQGTNGNDNLNGSSGKDLIFAYGGDDKVDASNGDDCIVAGPGDDKLDGSNGNDVVFGNEGDDKLDGGNGQDFLIAGSGNDNLFGTNGNDYMIGGSGNDKLDGGNGNDYQEGNEGDDTMVGKNGNDTLLGGPDIDFASGNLGTDTCDAETETNCEL